MVLGVFVESLLSDMLIIYKSNFVLEVLTKVHKLPMRAEREEIFKGRTDKSSLSIPFFLLGWYKFS